MISEYTKFFQGPCLCLVMSSGWTSGLSHPADRLLCFFNTSSASPTSGVPCPPGCQCYQRAYTEGCCISHHLRVSWVLPAPASSTTLGARRAYESCPLTALCPPPSVVLAPCRDSTGTGEIEFTGENTEAQSGQMGRMPLVWEAAQLVSLSRHDPSLPLCLLWHLCTIYSALTTSVSRATPVFPLQSPHFLPHVFSTSCPRALDQQGHWKAKAWKNEAHRSPETL